MALARTNSQPARGGQQLAGEHAGDRRRAFSVTLSRKAGPARSATSRISSQIGLPAVMPQVARGSAIIAQPWLVSTLSCRPGRQHALGPAAEAGKEVRLDKAGEDAHVGFHQPPVEPHRVAARGGAQRHQVGVVKGVVLLAAVVVHHEVAQHGPQLGRRLLAVGAQRVDQGDIARGGCRPLPARPAAPAAAGRWAWRG